MLSIVVPAYNEQASIAHFYEQLNNTAKKVSKNSYEIIYCDDGSNDETVSYVRKLSQRNKRVKLLSLTRNFGKEIATSAGIHASLGAAIIIIDADGQHPIELIPEFVKKWQTGSKVVVGLRVSNQKEGLVKRYGSKLFYRLINRVAKLQLVEGASDYRLIDASVRQEFMRLTERRRITRGLINWLGFQQEYIPFVAHARQKGKASYSVSKLIKLSMDSVVSLSLSPLFFMAYAGAAMLILSLLLGTMMVLNAFIGDPFGLNITGGAFVLVLLLFLVALVLVSQGIIGMYLSHIHTETQNRPLYLINHSVSVGVNDAQNL